MPGMKDNTLSNILLRTAPVGALSSRQTRGQTKPSRTR